MSACYPPHYLNSERKPMLPYYRAKMIAGAPALEEAGIGHGEHEVTHQLVEVIERGLKTRSPRMQAKYAPHLMALREAAENSVWTRSYQV